MTRRSASSPAATGWCSCGWWSPGPPVGPARARMRVRTLGRGARTGQRQRTQVDTIDVACWTARARAAALRLSDGSGVQVGGALRRRFFQAGSGRASRYEVEASSVRRVDLA